MGDLIKNNKLLRIQQAKASNTRERNIAKQYFNSGPSIGNLARAAYHWYNSVPGLGGEDESGNIIIGGEAPTPGMRSTTSILKDTKNVARGIQALTPRYNAFAKFYGYDVVPNGTNVEQAEQIIRQGLKQHNTFYRGLSVPKDKSAINKALGKKATDEEVLEYMAKNGSRNPENTYLAPDERAGQYTNNGYVAKLVRKYTLGENPETWIKDADFVYDITPATYGAPKGKINYPWAGQYIERTPPGEVRINPEDYTFEGWLPTKRFDLDDIHFNYVDNSNFNGSKNLYFNEAAGHHKPTFKTGGSIYVAHSRRDKQIVNNFKQKFLEGGLLYSIKNRFYNTIDPRMGYDIKFALTDFLNNNPKRHRDKESDLLLATYLGIPVKDRYYKEELKQSKYSPTKGNKNNIYYTVDLSEKDKKRLIENALGFHYGKYYPIKLYNDDDKHSILYDGTPLKIGQSKLSMHGYNNLGYYTISRGYDDKGEYVSYYDEWDLNPFKGNYGERNNNFLTKLFGVDKKGNLLDFLGKPVHFYDRIYLDDYYELKTPTHSTYLPEITIEGNNKSLKGKY